MWNGWIIIRRRRPKILGEEPPRVSLFPPDSQIKPPDSYGNSLLEYKICECGSDLCPAPDNFDSVVQLNC